MNLRRQIRIDAIADTEISISSSARRGRRKSICVHSKNLLRTDERLTDGRVLFKISA